MPVVRTVVLSALAAFALACAGTADGRAAPADSAAARGATTDASYDTTLLRAADLGRITGDSTAPLWLVMVSDFQCPYCKQFEDSTWHAIEARYVRTGKLRAAFLNLPLPGHANAWPAAEAAMCASAQGKFWAMHDSLFTAQPRWATLDRTDTMFVRFAASVGADTVRWRDCTGAHRMRPLIQGDLDRMTTAGVQSTPTFFVGDSVIAGAYPLDTFTRVIDANLARRRAPAR